MTAYFFALCYLTTHIKFRNIKIVVAIKMKKKVHDNTNTSYGKQRVNFINPKLILYYIVILL
jgi:hypothetical protein